MGERRTCRSAYNKKQRRVTLLAHSVTLFAWEAPPRGEGSTPRFPPRLRGKHLHAARVPPPAFPLFCVPSPLDARRRAGVSKGLKLSPRIGAFVKEARGASRSLGEAPGGRPLKTSEDAKKRMFVCEPRRSAAKREEPQEASRRLKESQGANNGRPKSCLEPWVSRGE